MNISNIRTISHYEAKILRRSWLFGLLTILSLSGVTAFHILFQGHGVRWTSWNMIALSSYVPYANVYLFGIIQAVVVVFLASDLLGVSRKMDTAETIHTRSMSNAEYVIGKAWGAIRIFMGVSLLSLFLGMGINIFISDAPFNGGMYFFYWIVFLFPALVFMIGLTFWGTYIIRNKPLTLLLLLGYLFLTLFYLNGFQQGLFDFLGSSIPNILSDITGYPDLSGVLLQRLFWLFLGMGFIGYTVVVFKRIPNHPGFHGARCGISTLFVVFGLACGVMVFVREYSNTSLRGDYRVTYEKYRPYQKLTLENQNIIYRQDGNKLIVKTCLRLKNEHAKNVNPIILYLNPGLKVDRLSKNGEDVDFFRDNQVVVIDETLDEGAILDIVMEYSGKINESICYLELPDEDVANTRTVVGSVLFRSGKRYAIAEKDYTLLTPECIWYPVSVPPVNLSNVYAVEKNFTRFGLQVVGEEGRSVLSQGDREESGDTLSFVNKHGLSGISLCIGDYKCYNLMVDSVSYELYVAEGHDDFLKYLSNIKDSMPKIISDHKNKVEVKNNRKYPYERFMIVESPISYASYYRNERGGSENVQPEMVFLPEKGVGFWNMNLKEMIRVLGSTKEYTKITDADVEQRVVEQLLYSMFISEYGYNTEPNPLLVPFYRINYSPSAFTMRGNLYTLSSLFYNHVNQLYSSEYPIVDMVLNNLLRGQDDTKMSQSDNLSLRSRSYRGAMNYLKSHSVEDALKDPGITSDILYQIVKLKSVTLKEQYFGLTIPTPDFDEFIRQYWEDHKYQKVNFTSFDEEFTEKFGISWMKVLPEWYTVNQIPSFVILDAYMGDIDDGKQTKEFWNTRSRIYVSIYNDSNVDGLVTLSYKEMSEPKGGRMSMALDNMTNHAENILIEAGKAKEIVIIPERGVISATLNTVISGNVPTIIPIIRSSKKTNVFDFGIKNIDVSCFLPKEGELIVDDFSDGFRVLQAFGNKRLRQWLNPDHSLEYKDYNMIFSSGLEEWKPVTNEGFYGKHTRSGWMKKGGKGDAKAEWSVDIEKAGYYEVFAYIPNRVMLQEFRRVGSGGVAFVTMGERKPIMQYYIVRHDGKESEVSMEISDYVDRGWVSLGRFYFSSGEASVVLTDQGSVDDQIIYADAVKWVFNGENEVPER